MELEDSLKINTMETQQCYQWITFPAKGSGPGSVFSFSAKEN